MGYLDYLSIDMLPLSLRNIDIDTCLLTDELVLHNVKGTMGSRHRGDLYSL